MAVRDSARRLAPDRVQIVPIPQPRVVALPVSILRPFSCLGPATAKGPAFRVLSPARLALPMRVRIARPPAPNAAMESRKPAIRLDTGETARRAERGRSAQAPRQIAFAPPAHPVVPAAATPRPTTAPAHHLYAKAHVGPIVLGQYALCEWP